MTEEKKKSKFRKCPKCKRDTILMICECGHFFGDKKTKVGTATSKDEIELK